MGKRGRTKERARGERKEPQESSVAWSDRRRKERKRELENARRRAARAAKKVATA